MKMNKRLREVMDDLTGLGMSVKLVRHQRHYCLLVGKGGRTARLFVAKTPSDFRDRLNTIRDAKRALSHE